MERSDFHKYSIFNCKEVLANPARFALDRFDYPAGSPNKEYGGEK